MRTRPLTALVVTASAGLLATSALAAPTGTTVEEVTQAGAVVTASGSAAFDGVSEVVSVGGTNTDFAAPPVSGGAGTDLVDAFIETLPEGAGLRFTWKLASLPAQVPPEGVRYTWSFLAGTDTFQLQAKRTNVGSLTVADDPAGHAGALAESGFFQLRGNCVADTMGAPVANCPHIAFLPGAFDTAAGTVSMDVPFDSEAAPAITSGVAIAENQTAGMSISAAFQAGVSNTATSDFINGWKPFYTGPQVALATGTATANPASGRYTPAALADDGTWAGSTDRVLASHKQLFVRSCEGAVCEFTALALPTS